MATRLSWLAGRFLHAPIGNALAGGCIAYAAATLVFILVLLKPGSWRDIKEMKLENASWFLAAAVLVAISQAFVYASLAIAPLMVVTPILQLSPVFRLFLSQWINRDHEVMNTAVLIGPVRPFWDRSWSRCPPTSCRRS